MNQSLGIVMLAAGSSSRLGQAKQLVTLDGQTLIRRMTQTGLDLATQCLDAVPIVVVLGANANRIEPELAGLPVTVVHNSDWKTGMASSLRVGLSTLLVEAPDTQAMLVLLTDQPYVSTALLTQLWQTFQATDKGIAACAYADRLGVPAIFSKSYFAAIQQLTGDRGASPLLRTYAADCIAVPFAEGVVDIDTPADLVTLNSRRS